MKKVDSRYGNYFKTGGPDVLTMEFLLIDWVMEYFHVCKGRIIDRDWPTISVHIGIRILVDSG